MMDFTDLNDNSREAELDYRELMSLLKFHNFLRKRNGQSPTNEPNYKHIFDKLEEVYPDLSFRAVDYRIFVQVRSESEGSLVEKVGFVNSRVPHMTTTCDYSFESVSVVFRSDGIGVIKEGPSYEFFEHRLDLVEVILECGNNQHARSKRLRDYFRDSISLLMEDPFFDPAAESNELHFEKGSQVELDRLMKLFILTEPGIDKHPEEEVCLYAGMEDRGPYLESRDAYCSRRLKNLAMIALKENRPVGCVWESNDGAYHRRSGYDRHPAILTWEIGEVIEQSSASEKMTARRELCEYLEARGFDIAVFDAMSRR
jgi:6-pyruvoyl-tetrahydropterin synthase